MLIKANRGVADADKLGLRIHPVNPRRTAIGVPRESPWLKLIGATPGSHTLRFGVAGESRGRGKPFGAIGLQLFVHVGEGKAEVTPGQAAYRLTCTRNPVGVGFEAEDGGKVATYFGRWCSRRGEVGPWSLPVRMYVV